MDTTQLILIAGILIMAGTNTVSLIWGFYANEKSHGKPTPKYYNVTVEGAKVFPDLDMAKVEEAARQQLLQVIGESSRSLQTSVTKTVNELGSKIDQTAKTSLTDETQKFQVSLQQLREQSIAAFNQLQTDINAQRSKLLEQLADANNAAKKQQAEAFSKELDARLNDVVSSYLTETLGNNVDLGAQTAYIFDALESHKQQIKQDLQL